MDNQKPEQSKAPKGPQGKPSGTRRRMNKNTLPTILCNAGQIQLLRELVREFAGSLKHAKPPSEMGADVDLTTTMPGLEGFIRFKLERLRQDQKRLEKLLG